MLLRIRRYCILRYSVLGEGLASLLIGDRLLHSPVTLSIWRYYILGYSILGDVVS